MQYFVRGKTNKINLSKTNFLARGGEGTIYRIGKTIYKIYEDVHKMIPEAKIHELAQVKSNCVIKPLEIIVNENNVLSGFTMSYVDGESLCKLFTNSFRDRNNITNDTITELVNNIKKETKNIHEAKCLIVDGNEFNYLVDKNNFTIPYFIDINSWQTPSFPATAIMPSIRDYNSNRFSVLTDWFSFAIITFQLFVGIHPYKGTHPKYKKGDIESRIRNNVSIFNKEVSIPQSTRDFSLIPSHYKQWYFDVFEKGKRTLPPESPGAKSPVTKKHIIVHKLDAFNIEQIRILKEKILFYKNVYGKDILKTEKSIYIDNEEFEVNRKTEVLLTPKFIFPVFFNQQNGMINLFSKNVEVINGQNRPCEDKLVYDSNLYIKNEESLLELSFIEFSGKRGNLEKIFVNISNNWQVMKYSSELFSNFIFQNVLGKPFISIPCPSSSGKSLFYTILVDELINHRIVSGKYESNVCVLLTYHNGVYNRVILKFNMTYDKYTFDITTNVDPDPINFTVLDQGIVVMIPTDETLILFSNKYLQDSIKEIKDKNISTDMKLCKMGSKARFFKDNVLYSIEMKK